MMMRKDTTDMMAFTPRYDTIYDTPIDAAMPTPLLWWYHTAADAILFYVWWLCFTEHPPIFLPYFIIRPPYY